MESERVTQAPRLKVHLSYISLCLISILIKYIMWFRSYSCNSYTNLRHTSHDKLSQFLSWIDISLSTQSQEHALQSVEQSRRKKKKRKKTSKRVCEFIFNKKNLQKCTLTWAHKRWIDRERTKEREWEKKRRKDQAIFVYKLLVFFYICICILAVVGCCTVCVHVYLFDRYTSCYASCSCMI